MGARKPKGINMKAKIGSGHLRKAEYTEKQKSQININKHATKFFFKWQRGTIKNGDNYRKLEMSKTDFFVDLSGIRGYHAVLVPNLAPAVLLNLTWA